MRITALAVVVFSLVSGAPRARAYPFLAPRPIPGAIAGPTDPHVAATFYNPAALGPLRGLHVFVDGGARLHEGSIARSDLEGVARGSDTINWADLDAFVGLSWDLNTDSFIIGLSAYTPYNDLSSFSPNSPLRFHNADTTFMVLEETAAAAYKVSGRLFIGAAANFAQSWLSWRFSRDAAIYGGSPGIDSGGGLCGARPCGLENPLAEQRLRLRGFGWGLGFSVGVLARPIDRLWLAASYTSHIFNTGLGTDLPMHDQTRASATPAPGQGTAGCNGSCSGNDLITAAIPDIVQAGVRVEVTPRFDLESAVRYIHYGIRSAVDVQLQGGTLGNLADPRFAGTALPPEQLYDRGLQDAWAVELSGRWKLLVGETLRLSPSLLFETAAVAKSAVSAATLDGPKIDIALTAEWHPIRHLLIGGHVGGTAYVLGDVKSRFDPRGQAACVDSRYSLDACAGSNAGQGLPSASGNYTLFVVHVSGAIGIDY